LPTHSIWFFCSDSSSIFEFCFFASLALNSCDRPQAKTSLKSLKMMDLVVCQATELSLRQQQVKHHQLQPHSNNKKVVLK
jgi:hypothetical protein